MLQLWKVMTTIIYISPTYISRGEQKKWGVHVTKSLPGRSACMCLKMKHNRKKISELCVHIRIFEQWSALHQPTTWLFYTCFHIHSPYLDTSIRKAFSLILWYWLQPYVPDLLSETTFLSHQLTHETASTKQINSSTSVCSSTITSHNACWTL